MTATAGIVWLASFPKSGNTWFRIFLANLAAGENGPADINNLDERGGIASSRHEFEAATMLDSGLLPHDVLDRLRPRVYEHIAGEAKEQRWIKVHDAYTKLPDGEPMLGRAAQAVVYLVRDPRDVAVSLAHHSNTTIGEAITAMCDTGYAFCHSTRGQPNQLRQQLLSWSGHAQSWMDQSDVPVHAVRYEALHADPMTHFRAALAFAGRPVTDEEIARAIRHADFSELQRQEGERGFGEGPRRDAPFFRAGRVGGWKDVLSAEQVALIQSAHAPMMRRLGYLPASED